MKSISYSSSIYNTDNLPSVLESSFTLVKQFNCFTKDNLDLMIDKLVGLKDDFKKIKTSFNATQDALDQAEKKLSTGKGNLTNQAKELQDMGARSKKVLSDFDNE